MSTPNMSGRTDDAPTRDDHLDATDLLNADGSINLSAVRSITNAENAPAETITAERCAAIREQVLASQHATETAARFGIGSTATRRHAKGDCHHIEAAVDHPPLCFERGDGWRAEE